MGVDDWESAVARTPGYGALDSSGPPTRPEMPLWMSARTQQVMAAFGSALDRCQGRDVIRVLDVGGARGDYAGLIALSYPKRRFKWTVLETPETARRQKPFESDDLVWVDSMDAVDPHVDIVLASAVIQFLEDPHQRLTELLARSDWLVLNRVPLWPIPDDAPAVHRARVGGPVLYPCWMFAEHRFLATLRMTGEVVLRWHVPQDVAFFAGVRRPYQGLLVRGQSVGDHAQ